MSWKESKDAGQQAFVSENYPEALNQYTNAIDLLTSGEQCAGSSTTNTKEHQVLLSNVIACRLKIGGVDMATQAVEDSKQCIALNNKWAKAHVRLAASYIALGNHSNDACLSLQRALSLDKNNKVARQMLVKEMRSRNAKERNDESTSNSDNNTSDHPTPSAPPADQSQSTNSNNNSSRNYDGIDVDDVNTPPPGYSLSFTERIQHYASQAIQWFHSQSDDIQTLVKVLCVFLILYLALGGRFGLDYALDGGSKSTANYGHGNAYDRYKSGSSSTQQNRYQERSYDNERQYDRYTDPQQQRRTTNTGYNDRSTQQNQKYYSKYENGNDYQYYDPPPRQRQRSTSYQLPNLFDGSMASMAILIVIGLTCHYFGINPMQVMMMLNMMNGRGRHYGGMRYGGGYGGGGFGGGFGRRNRFRRGRRW